MATLREKYGYLPAVLVTVLEAAGEDVMLRLVATLGGNRVYVASEPRLGSKLADAVGLDAARKIQIALADMHIMHFDVPTMAGRLALIRTERILALRHEGLKVADIARSVGMTERGVYMALARSRDDAPDERQISLF